MSNISSIGRASLRSCAKESATEQVLRCRKIIVCLESSPEEISHRITQDLRATLKRVLSGKVTASSEEVEAAGVLLLRVKALDPRRAKRLEDKTEVAEASTPAKTKTPNIDAYVRPAPIEAPREPDGFLRGLISPEEAIARCSVAGFTPSTLIVNDSEKILQIALGETPLNEQSVGQLWLTWAYSFKEKWSRTLSPMAKKIQTAICHYANPRGFSLRTPDIFTFSDELDFRSF